MTPLYGVEARAADNQTAPRNGVLGRSGGRGRRQRPGSRGTVAINALHTPPAAPDPRRASRQALRNQLADVLDGKGLLRAQDLPPEIHHGETERAGGGDSVGLRLHRFLDADQVHALFRAHLHPHVAAAAAAAEPPRAAARQLDEPQAGHRPGHRPWRLEDPVVAAEVAGVVERDRLVDRLGRPDPALPEQALDDHRMVEHLPAPAELRELVLERVEAVRAVGDHLAKAVTLEVADVLPLHRLMQVLLAEAPRDLAVAPLLLHHGERHT